MEGIKEYIIFILAICNTYKLEFVFDIFIIVARLYFDASIMISILSLHFIDKSNSFHFFCPETVRCVDADKINNIIHIKVIQFSITAITVNIIRIRLK